MTSRERCPIRKPRTGSLARLLPGVVALAIVAACSGGGDSGNPTGPSPTGPGQTPPAGQSGPSSPFDNDPAFPEVWATNAFDGQTYEFKTNCVGNFVALETCFLWDLTSVVTEAPDGRRYELEKDFNIQAFSGEVTRRWVLYGPSGAGLPAPGDYRFLYYQGTEVVLTQVVSYTPVIVGYPTGILWNRDGNDIVVQWTPPAGAAPGMNYKVLLFPFGGEVISAILDWNASSARLSDIPLADGAQGTLNVAIYWSGGFAPSEYLPLTW